MVPRTERTPGYFKRRDKIDQVKLPLMMSEQSLTGLIAQTRKKVRVLLTAAKDPLTHQNSKLFKQLPLDQALVLFDLLPDSFQGVPQWGYRDDTDGIWTVSDEVVDDPLEGPTRIQTIKADTSLTSRHNYLGVTKEGFCADEADPTNAFPTRASVNINYPKKGQFQAKLDIRDRNFVVTFDARKFAFPEESSQTSGYFIGIFKYDGTPLRQRKA